VDGIYIDITRQNCRAQDEANDDSFYKKNFNISAGFWFSLVTESIMSWDWIMSIDHIGSVLCLMVRFIEFRKWYHCDCISYCVLKSKGYLEHVNTSHIHDLAKFMFGFSIFWTYLCFHNYVDMVCKYS
jgi:hypothetical protein